MRKIFFIAILLLSFLLIFNCPTPETESGSSGGSSSSGGGGDDSDDKVAANLQVFRTVTKADGVPIVTEDTFTAEFGEDIDICGIISSPLKAGGVTCNGETLFWMGATSSFDGYMRIFLVPFLEYSTNYTFNVTASSDVPALTKSIIFPSFNPDITSPIPGKVDKSNDLTIEWDKGDGNGTVLIIFSVDSETGGFSFETDNDGSEVISSDDQLSTLPDGDCAIVVESRNYDTINALGYDSRSFILARSLCTVLVELE